jgi:hypothetical protein
MRKRTKPISKYVRDFFPPAFRGVMRFTELSLRYATPYAKARSMVEVMNKHMPDGRYRVVEVFSGIGCNTMAFMECRRIVVTDAYEGDSLTAQRLAANVGAWATVLQCQPPRVHASTADVVAVASASGYLASGTVSVVNTAVFFDPPWGDEPPYVNPLSFKLADGSTVEECTVHLLAQPGVHLVAVKVPKGTFPVNPLPENVVLERHTSLKKMDLLCFKCK